MLELTAAAVFLSPRQFLPASPTQNPRSPGSFSQFPRTFLPRTPAVSPREVALLKAGLLPKAYVELTYFTEKAKEKRLFFMKH